MQKARTAKPAGFLLCDESQKRKRRSMSGVFVVFALKYGAGNETRTRDPDLGKVVLYQLSYSRGASTTEMASPRGLEPLLPP